MPGMRRREFVALLGGAAAVWPLAARAQQPPAMPVIGYLSAGSIGQIAHLLAAFREGMAETGYVEGQNVKIEYRFAESRYDRLPGLAADLVDRRVAVIVTGATIPTALAAKAASATIPIVFGVGDDPAKLGLVTSLARPGGNATGVNFFSVELGGKVLGLLRELVPNASRVGLLVNPLNPGTEAAARDLMAAAPAIGAHIYVVEASDNREIEAAFATLVRNKADALLIGPDPFFYVRRIQLGTLAARHAIPTVSLLREYADAGGLMSYGTNLLGVYRQMGVYTGRILKGVKPADLPVVQSTKFELVINLATARVLGLDVPPSLLARADEVIE
jgi:putative tryptophan/tyrosine transport system substrate-binding protein